MRGVIKFIDVGVIIVRIFFDVKTDAVFVQVAKEFTISRRESTHMIFLTATES